MRNFWFISSAKVCALICFLAGGFVLTAQDYFGKNKVQYEKITFQKKETNHFLLFYPEGGEMLANFASSVVEDHAEFLEKNLKWKKKDKTPIILYPSFFSFSQTNIILDLIEEGIGGFAELLKRRVVVPFDGDLLLLERTLRHEVSHIYEYEIFFKRGLGIFGQKVSVPLFILEGFSEYSASKFLGPDGLSNIYLRYYVVRNKFSLENLARDHSYLSYRLGEAFFFFIEERYGEEKVYELLEVLRKKGFAEGIKNVFGKSPAHLGEDFVEYLRLQYFPLYSLRGSDSLINFLTHSKAGVYNTTPVIAPKGDKILFLSNAQGDFVFYLTDVHSGKILQKGLRFNWAKEDVRFLKRAATITSAPEEEIALFVAREGKKELRILDRNLKLKKKFSLSLDECFEPSFSPDGRRLVFVGLKDGFSDLYTISLETGEVERLTATFADEFSPSWTPDGETIIFAKRKEEGDLISRKMEIWGYAVREGVIFKLAGDFKEVRDPIRLPSGEILFRGEDRQIFLIDTSGKTLKTNFFSGFDYLSLAHNGRLSFSYFRQGSWEIGVTDLEKIRPLLKPAEPESIPELITLSSSGEKGKPAGFSLSADYVQGALSWAQGFFSGYAYLSLSDILGDHRFLLLTDLSGVIDFANFYFSYWYLKERIDYNFTIYQFFYGYETQDRIWTFRDRGLFPGISYPFSKVERIETGIGLATQDKRLYRKSEELIPIDSSYSFSSPYFLAYVFDNTIWQIFGPKKGMRTRVSGEISFFGRNYTTGYIDFRRYLNFFSDYTLALRLLNIGSFGREPDSFYISGEFCRGYEYYQFIDTKGIFLSVANLEFRFPLIKEMKLGLPPISFRNIAGRLFWDGAALWKNSRSWREKDSWFTKFNWGFGIGVYIPPLPIRVDFSYPLSRMEDRKWRITLLLGEEF